MNCEFCGSESVVVKHDKEIDKLILWDVQKDASHNCTVPVIFCPSCMKLMTQQNPCEHYKKLAYRPGENESFFIQRIKFPPAPKQNKKWIGTSAGNTRTKNTRCKFPGCNKDLNNMSYEKIQEHVRDHDKKKISVGQEKLF